MPRLAFRIVAIAVCLGGMCAWAGEEPPPTPQATEARSPPRNERGEPQVGPVQSARSILGMPVSDAKGRSIGKVEDLGLDLEEGFVGLVMVTPEDGNHGARLALPIKALEFTKRGLKLTADVSARNLDKAPRLKADQELRDTKRLWAATVYQYFEVEPYWAARQQTSTWGPATKYGKLYNKGKIKTIAGEIDAVDYLAPLPGMAVGAQLTVRTDDGIEKVQLGPLSYLSKQGVSFKKGERVEVTGSPVKIDGSPILMAATVKHGDQTLTLRDAEGHGAWPEWDATDDEYAFVPLSSLRGMPVTNSAGVDLGKIEDFAVATDSGLLAYAAMACSCLPDASGKLHPIPLSAFIVKPGAKAWILELPLDVLANTKPFPTNDWPEEIDRGWVEYVHVRYGRSPFSGVREEERKLR